MLTVLKNEVVASSTCNQADVRQLELDLYTNNFWIWGNAAGIMAGFMFDQITIPLPDGTRFDLECAYLVLTSLCLGLNLCVISWTVLLCMWGPGMALRGPEGMKSFHETVDFLEKEQRGIYFAFSFSVLAYFGCTAMIVWVFPSRTLVNMWAMAIMLFLLIVLILVQCRLEVRIGGGFRKHEGPDGRIHGFKSFEQVQDLDFYASQHAPAPPGYTQYPGLHESSQPEE